MKKVLSILCTAVLACISTIQPVKADEGMWLPIFVQRLNYVDMQKAGLKLTAEEIYSINHSSLKDAIVNFGGFCTGEIVSDQGLIFTNHHCGYSAIQEHSSVDHDYLTDGFWAMNQSEELPNEGLYVSFLQRMDDVTKDILGVTTPDMDEKARGDAIRKKSEELRKAAEENGKYRVELKSFFNGNEYYMFVYVDYKDVRLVGAPPSSIGKFGGDTDNWMWPRHTGDFSVFRVYCAPDGSPATYSKDNVPLKPKHFLPISIKGLKKDDYAMIWGYPGTTDRYRTSAGVQLTLNQDNPAITTVLGKILEAEKKGMDTDPAVRIQYASKYASLANFWKNKLGETRDLKRLDVFSKKKALEDQFEAWVAKDPSRKEKYGDVIPTINELYGKIIAANSNKVAWYTQLSFYGSQTLSAAQSFGGVETVLKKGLKSDELKKELEKYYGIADETYKEYNVPIEKDVLAAVLKAYYENIPQDQQADIFKNIEKKYKGNFNDYVADIFKNSIFATKENFTKFLDKPSLKKYENDPLRAVSKSLIDNASRVNSAVSDISPKLGKARRLFVAGIREMQPDKSFYPDANSTMRMTYGKVLGYEPADAVTYDYVTYLDGVMAKENPSDEEFVVPAKLKQLYQAKDYGRYGTKDGRMVVCFLTDNDITGGNSGSPVIDGSGNLIGLAFDGNWEAMSGNILFEPELQRTINVDARYVLFIIDKYAGASNIIKELKIVE